MEEFLKFHPNGQWELVKADWKRHLNEIQEREGSTGKAAPSAQEIKAKRDAYLRQKHGLPPKESEPVKPASEPKQTDNSLHAKREYKDLYRPRTKEHKDGSLSVQYGSKGEKDFRETGMKLPKKGEGHGVVNKK